MYIYEGKINGFNFLTGSYDESIQISWPCGENTRLTNPNLFDLGTAIGEHAIECGVCTDGRVRKKAGGP
jgi:hypothetical protein